MVKFLKLVVLTFLTGFLNLYQVSAAEIDTTESPIHIAALTDISQANEIIRATGSSRMFDALNSSEKIPILFSMPTFWLLLGPMLLLLGFLISNLDVIRKE